VRVVDRRTLVGALGVAAISPGAFAGVSDPAALRADIALLQRIYGSLHPGLYRYQTPSQFAERCAELEKALPRPASMQSQYLQLSRLLAQVKCGHTYANFFNQSKDVSRVLIDPANKLPFHFIWLRDRIVVTANPLGVDGLRTGDEILSINGAPAGAIQAMLLPYVRADGSNDDKRRVLLNVTGNDKISTFDVFFPLLFPSDRAQFTLEVKRLHGPVRALKVAPIDQARRRSMAPKGLDIGSPDYWSLAWPKPNVAVMTMPSWAMYDVKWDWKARIAAMFDEIATKGAKGLVIDLRDNEGGDDCGYEIVARLVERELPLFVDYERRVRFRSTPADLNPYLDTWDTSFRHLGDGADDLGNGFFRLRGDDESRRIVPKGPRFTGKVIVLSSAQNSSATFQFIDLVRRAGLARIYGQPTGGNQRGINGGSFFFVRLPNSGLEADLPLVGLFPKIAKPDAGLRPDLRIDPTPEDIASGYDRGLQKAVGDLT